MMDALSLLVCQWSAKLPDLAHMRRIGIVLGLSYSELAVGGSDLETSGYRSSGLLTPRPPLFKT